MAVSSIVSSIMGSIVSLVGTPIVEQMKYMFNVRANMRNLKKAVDGLKLTKKEAEGKIKSATEARDDEVPTERVLKWLDKVQIKEREVTKIEDDHNQLKMCIGGCPLNCWSGYKVSKRAADALADVKELLEEEGKMVAVTMKVTPALRPMPDSTLPLPATEILLDIAIKYLKDETVGMIGIWGTGGVGKTTLLKRINNHPEVGSAGYNFVIWVVVSQEFNPYKLQRDIAEGVGLKFEEQNTTTESQAKSLGYFLKNKKLLLLLDDIWQWFDLEKLGIPSLGSSDNKLPQSKVVFTTRSDKVCDRMAAIHAQGGHKKIRVECLTPKEAWELFFNTIGETVQNIIKSDGRVRERAQTVANKCAGLPLALVVIARAMSGNKTRHEWEVAVNSINNLRLQDLVDEQTDPLYLVLKFSYDRFMNDQMRKCFLSCALWPEDHKILKDNLIRCWLGMGLIADFSNINVAISKGHSIIESLKGAAMLEETTDEEFTIYVKLHDIIRGMALWIASDCGEKRNKWIVRTGVQMEKEKWREAEIISLTDSEIQSLQQFPYCPNLNALMLRDSTYFKEDVFIQFPALTYLDLSGSRYRVGSLSLPKELVNLTKLKYLFIRHTKIESMPHGLISGLQKLEILDLSHTDYERWEEEGEASVEELGSISAGGGLKALGIMLPLSLLQRLSSNHPHVPLWHLQIRNKKDYFETLRFSQSLFPGGIFPRSLQSLKLESYYVEEMFIAGGKEDQFDNLEVLEFINLWKLRKITWERGVVPQVLFQNLSSLSFIGCLELKDVTWIAQLPYLEILIIHHSQRMEQVIGGAEAAENSRVKILPNLKFLSLLFLPRLRSFCSPQITLPSLQRFKISWCPRLNRSFLKKTNAKSQRRRNLHFSNEDELPEGVAAQDF